MQLNHDLAITLASVCNVAVTESKPASAGFYVTLTLVSYSARRRGQTEIERDAVTNYSPPCASFRCLAADCE